MRRIKVEDTITTYSGDYRDEPEEEERVDYYQIDADRPVRNAVRYLKDANVVSDIYFGPFFRSDDERQSEQDFYNPVFWKNRIKIYEPYDYDDDDSTTSTRYTLEGFTEEEEWEIFSEVFPRLAEEIKEAEARSVHDKVVSSMKHRFSKK